MAPASLQLQLTGAQQAGGKPQGGHSLTRLLLTRAMPGHCPDVVAPKNDLLQRPQGWRGQTRPEHVPAYSFRGNKPMSRGWQVEGVGLGLGKEPHNCSLLV